MSILEPDDVAMVVCELGTKGDLTPAMAKEAARAFVAALIKWPTTEHMISLDGFDDDPRELWDIPEARKFICQFAAETNRLMPPGKKAADYNINEQSIGLIAMCLGHAKVTERYPDGGYRIELSNPWAR